MEHGSSCLSRNVGKYFPIVTAPYTEIITLSFGCCLHTGTALSYSYNEIMGILCMTVFWDVTACILIARKQSFGGIYCLQLQGSRVSSAGEDAAGYREGWKITKIAIESVGNSAPNMCRLQNSAPNMCRLQNFFPCGVLLWPEDGGKSFLETLAPISQYTRRCPSDVSVIFNSPPSKAPVLQSAY
jgi:hypothetical protein